MTSIGTGARWPTRTPTRASSSPKPGWPRRQRAGALRAPDELHTAFNFEFLVSPWRADLRATIDRTLRRTNPVGAPATWVLANHDVARGVALRARAAGSSAARPRRSAALSGRSRRWHPPRARGGAADAGPAWRRVHLPGPGARPAGGRRFAGRGPARPALRADGPSQPRPGRLPRTDPVVRCAGALWLQSTGCDGAALAAPASGWAALSVAAETGAPDSMLELYRRALGIRRAQPALGDGSLDWLEAPNGALIFTRGRSFVCVVNTSADPIPLPDTAQLMLASGPLTPEGRLPADTTVWLSVPEEPTG